MRGCEVFVGLPEYQVTGILENGPEIFIEIKWVGQICCPYCGESEQLRKKDIRQRRIHHENLGTRRITLLLSTLKHLCRQCSTYFWQRFPGIGTSKRVSEPAKKTLAHYIDSGMTNTASSKLLGISFATAERLYQERSHIKANERSSDCPLYLGIDEHHFSKDKGFMTTFCNLKTNRVHEVVLGRSEQALEPYLSSLKGKERVQMVCIDLSTTYRSTIKKHFPNARICADRFHVIRLINHHFLSTWKQIDPAGAKNRGLMSLMRRHEHNLKDEAQKQRLRSYLAQYPGLEACYDFKQTLCTLLGLKAQTHKQCKRNIVQLLKAIRTLKDSDLPHLQTLAETLESWQEEIAMMWRFTKNNAITEGFHNKMETIQRKAYGFRNFENFRARVKVLC